MPGQNGVDYGTEILGSMLGNSATGYAGYGTPSYGGGTRGPYGYTLRGAGGRMLQDRMAINSQISKYESQIEMMRMRGARPSEIAGIAAKIGELRAKLENMKMLEEYGRQQEASMARAPLTAR